MPSWTLLLALCGCTTPVEPLDPSPAEPLVGMLESVGLVAEDTVGNAPLEVTIRAVNAFHAAVPAANGTVTVDGGARQVSFDGVGYGSVTLTEPGTYTLGGLIEPVEVSVLASAWPGFGMNRAHPAPTADASQAAPVSGGSLVIEGADLWFVGPDVPPQKVLSADAPLLGMRTAHLDVDENVDAVLWSAFKVFVLKGRTGGGMAWGTALEAGTFNVGGAAIGDVSGDNLPDLAIAWTADSEGVLDVWNGDGLLGFEAAEPLEVLKKPTDMAIGDNTGEGQNQITMTHDDGTWSRYIAGTEYQYMPIGPLTPTEGEDAFQLPAGATVEADGDANNDDADELWFFGPLNPSSGRQIHVIDITGELLEVHTQLPVAGLVARADADSNSLVDLIMLDEQKQLQVFFFDTSSFNRYTALLLTELPAHAPITLHDVLGDDVVPDLFQAGSPYWTWWIGANDPDDPTLYWSRSEPPNQAVSASNGHMAVVELDADPTSIHLLTYAKPDATSVLLVVSAMYQLDRQATSLGAVTIFTGNGAPDPLDMAFCSGFVWTIVGNTLSRVDVRNPGVPVQAGTLNTLGTRVACAPAGAPGEAMVLVSNQVDHIDGNMQVVRTDKAQGARDIAPGDASMPIGWCETDGCSIAWWQWSPDEGGFLMADPLRAEIVTTTGQRTELSGSGRVAVDDVDDDGNPDAVMVGLDGVVAVHRSTGTSIAAAALFHTLRSPQSGIGFADADGDGHKDLWLLSGGEVRHTVSPFWYPGITEPPLDTGGPADTGTATRL